MEKFFFKKALANFVYAKFMEALSKDAQKLYNYFVERNVEDVSCDAYFHENDFFSSSVEEKLEENFKENMINTELDDLSETMDYLFEILVGVSDEDFAENELDDFAIYVVKSINPKYDSLQSFYNDYGEFFTSSVLKDYISEEWEKMKSWESESCEFSYFY